MNGTSTKIDFIGSDSLDTYDFVIQRSTNGNWATAGNILFTKPGKALTYIDNGVNTQKQHLCYTIIARDSCLNATPSDTFCIMQLKGDSLNLADSLAWSHFKGYKIQKYDVLQLVGNKWDTLAKLNNNDTSYTQKPLPCDVPQTYKIEGFENGGTYVTFSDSITLTPSDTIKPPAPVIKYATVLNDSQIELFWHKSISKVKLYELSIKTGNGIWKVADTVKIDSSFIFSKLNTPDSIYDFRIVAIDSCAQNRSKTSVFHSPVQLSGKGQNLSNLLTWKKYEGWKSVKKYYIYQLIKASWIRIDSVSGTTLTYLQPKLPCDVTQSYKILSIDNTGQYLSYSDTAKLTPFDTIKPPAPVIDYATVLSDNEIQLFWNKSVPKVKLYELSYKTGKGPWKVLTEIYLDTSFTFSGLNTRDSVYSFRVVAIDSCAGNRSAYSKLHSPVRIIGTPLDDSVSIKWTPYIGFSPVKEYYIYQYGPFGWVALDSVKGNVTSYKSKAMPCNVPQAYSIGTVDNKSQFVSQSDSIHIEPFDTIKPKAPVLYYATVLPNQAVKLSWHWDTKTDVKYFEIWRSANGGALSLIDTVIYDSTYIDTKANVRAIRYAYSIVAIDSCSPTNRSHKSNTDSLINLKISTYNCTPQVNLSWTSYFGLGVSAYTVYRSTNGTNFTVISSLKPSQFSFTDNTVSLGNRYYYLIEATNGSGGYTSYSDTAGIIPSIVPLADSAQLVYATVLKSSETDGSIMVRWRRDNRLDSNARGYYVYSFNTTNGKYSLVEDQTDLNDTTYIDNSINTLQFTYRYYIVIYNICDQGINSKIHRPILLTVNNGNLNAQLIWRNYLGISVKSYTIYKSTDHGPSYFFANTGTDTTLSDSNIYCNHNYTYIIQAALANKEISFSDSVTINAFDTVRPVTKPIQVANVVLTGIANGEVSLFWNKAVGPNLEGYYIYRSDDGIVWNLINQAGLSTSFIDKGLNTYGQSYYYRIQPFDSCGNLGDYSAYHQTIHLKANARDGYNQFNWNAYVGWNIKEYILVRNGKKIASVGKNITSFRDTLIYCDTTYQYQVFATGADVNDTFGLTSNTDSVKSFNNIGPRNVYIKIVTVSKPNKAVTITWVPSRSFGVKQYYIYRKYAIDGSMKLIGISSDTTYTDSSTEVLQPDCYYVFAGDYCKNMSNASNEGCIMILSAKNKEGYNDLSWNGYQTWYNGVQTYNVYKNEDNQGWSMIGTTSSGIIDSFVDNNLTDTTIDFCYQVEAIENPGQYNQVSHSTVECVHQNATIFIPNSFTPYNQDGINDLFGPKGIHIRNFTMQIYDRWGEEIFNTTSGKSWNGNFHGQPVQQGIYVYYITVQDYNGHVTRFKGTLTMFE